MRRGPSRSQWRDRAGFSPCFPGHRPLDGVSIQPVMTRRAPMNRFRRRCVGAGVGGNRESHEPDENTDRLRHRPLPTGLEAGRPRRGGLGRHPQPRAVGRGRDVHALHDGHRDPHRDLPPGPSGDPCRQRPARHGLPLVLGVRGALARRGLLGLPTPLRHRGAAEPRLPDGSTALPTRPNRIKQLRERLDWAPSCIYCRR